MSQEPKQIILETQSLLKIIWHDGKEDAFDALKLRCSCPCASCINEWTGERILDDQQIKQDIKIEDISLVGRYAINLRFSDGHETGIYSFEYLKNLASEN
ncbi:MAG: DUF971 domain-containing protein [Acidobacteria bacterium]|nr:MAG: DUF971 domain-containing protein [Acidobacteriota bacterium]